ncbi:hypothetical protein ODV97_19105 [Enterococcus gallinarum]|nr:hypothetical protein [Enterococcus gallinarum]
MSGTLLEAFNAMETNTRFILTSHELHLMDNQLRKDQIYFTDKIIVAPAIIRFV